MNTLEKINRAKYQTSKEILEKAYELYNSMEFESYEEYNIVDEFYNRLQEYISRDHLFESDYTKN